MSRWHAWVLGLSVAVAFTPPGFAQPKRQKPAKEASKSDKAAADKADKEASKSDKATEKTDKAAEKADKAAPAEPSAETDAAAPEAATPGAADDLGAPPPKTAGSGTGERPSPLNPRANEFPAATAALPPRAYDDLLAEIATLRGRVAALTTTLFASKLRISVTSEGENARIARLVVTVDDGVVYSAPARFTADEPRVVYEHAVAPGYHVVAVDVERYDSRNQQYRTWQTSKFSVVVPESKRLDAALLIEDDSGIAEDFPDDQDGEYELQVRLRASVEE